MIQMHKYSDRFTPSSLHLNILYTFYHPLLNYTIITFIYRIYLFIIIFLKWLALVDFNGEFSTSALLISLATKH